MPLRSIFDDNWGVGILNQTANQPFPITLLAQNRSGDFLNSYSGTASLSAIGLPAGSITPSQTGAFTNGIWSGSIIISLPATNLVVSAQNGSASGQSNPFDVAPGFVSTINTPIADMVY